MVLHDRQIHNKTNIRMNFSVLMQFNIFSIVTCLSTINCLKKRQRQKLRRADLVPEVVHEEINSKLTPLGIVGEPLRLVGGQDYVCILVLFGTQCHTPGT